MELNSDRAILWLEADCVFLELYGRCNCGFGYGGIRKRA